jgi:phage shock protein A
MSKAMAVLSEEVGQDAPTFEEVRQKIEARYAKARGSAELTESSVASRMREIEAATANVEAKSRLSAMKVELGLAKGPSPEELLAASAPDADEEAEVVASEGDVPPAG